MSLPKINTPTYTTKLPVSGKMVKYRPFLVKEEKMIILAITETDEQLKAINLMEASLNVTQNCIITEGVIVKDLAIGDFEWLFMKLRMVSKGESVGLNIKCANAGLVSSNGEVTGCKHPNLVKVNLAETTVENLVDNRIDLGGNIKIIMKFPSMAMVLHNMEDDGKDTTFDLRMIYDSLDMIIVGEEVYDSFTFEEFDEFSDQFTSHMMEKIRDFFKAMPTITQTVEFVCEACQHENSLTLKGSKDFFA